MEPIGNGVLIALASSIAMALIAGAVIGAVVWMFRWSLPVGVVCLGVYEVFSPRLYGNLAFPEATTPPLMMTFLAAYLTGRTLRVHRHVKLIWAALAALGSSVALAVLYVLALRARFPDDVWTLVWVALGIDVCLALLVFRTWNPAPTMK